MQAQLDALQTEQPSVSSDGVPDGSANANVEHESLDTEANSRQNLEAEDPDQQLQQPHAEVVSLSDRCEALSVELQGARERVQSLQLECARSQSQYEALGTAVAGHLGLVRVAPGEAAAALAAHEAAHEAKTSELHDAVAAAQREIASAQMGHADSLVVAESRALELQKERGALGERLKSLEATNSELTEELSSYEERHAGLTDQHRHLEAELATLQETLGQHEALQSEHADLSAQFSSLQEKHANLTQQHEALKQEHSALQRPSQFADTQNALDNLQKECDAVRQELAAKEKALAEHAEAAVGQEQLRGQLQQLQATLDTAEKKRASVMQQLEALQVRHPGSSELNLLVYFCNACWMPCIQ